MLEADGDGRVLEGRGTRNHADDAWLWRPHGEIAIGEPELGGQRLRDARFGGEIQPREHDPEPFARPLLLGERHSKAVVGDEPGVHQTLTHLSAHDVI